MALKLWSALSARMAMRANSSSTDRALLHVDRSRSMVKNMQQLKALQQPLRV
ncbi:hypothetical protein ACLMJV_08445 [Sinorhizobium meliloti]|uniref:hypothetical protein n=1 Tax=Rhizobium meliloti TaxID=382 RepID=UPI00398D3C1E